MGRPLAVAPRRLSGLVLALVVLAGLVPSAGAETVDEFLVASGRQPARIVAGPDGNLWFTEFAGDRIGRITPAGVVTEFVLTPGAGPLGITVGPDALIYFTERLGDRIGRINPAAGTPADIQASLVEFLVPGAGSAPHDITVGPDGALWFTQFGSDEIGRITTAGVVTDEFPVPGTGPSGIAAGPDGALWFTEAGANRIGRLTTDGTLANEFPLPPGSDPEGITLGPDGAFWFTQFGADQIGRITIAGLITSVQRPPGSAPIVIVGALGALWTTEAGADRISRLLPAGGVLEFPTPTPLSQPAGISAGPAGTIWFTEVAASKIGRITVSIPPPKLLVTGAGFGGGPHVRELDAGALTDVFSFFAYPPSFTGGVRVALGDVNGDGTPDIIVGAGPGLGVPHVQVFSGTDLGLLRSFFAYDPFFTGGVFVAAADLDGDGLAEIITGADAGGGPHVKVFDGATGAEKFAFFAYDPAFTGGVRVAVGDVNHDGIPDIITGAGPGGGAHVKAFSGSDLSLLKSFLAYDPAFTGGVFVAAGDVNGDGFADIVTGAGGGGGPHVKVFDGATGGELFSFFAYDPAFTGGVRVAVGDVNGDGFADIVTAPGPGGGPHVEVFNGADLSLLESFFAYDPLFTGGVFVAK
jgi:streptogramin lyase